jgi:hypothetical protein
MDDKPLKGISKGMSITTTAASVARHELPLIGDDEDTADVMGGLLVVRSEKVRRGQPVVEKRRKRGRPAGKKNTKFVHLSANALTSEAAGFNSGRTRTSSHRPNDRSLVAAADSSAVNLHDGGKGVLDEELIRKEGEWDVGYDYNDNAPTGSSGGEASSVHSYEHDVRHDDRGSARETELPLPSTETQALVRKVLGTFLQLKLEVRFIEDALDRCDRSRLWLAGGLIMGMPSADPSAGDFGADDKGDAYRHVIRRLTRSCKGDPEGQSPNPSLRAADDASSGSTPTATDGDDEVPHGAVGRSKSVSQRELLEQQLMHSREVLKQAQQLLRSLEVNTDSSGDLHMKSGATSAGLVDMSQAALGLLLPGDCCTVSSSGSTLLHTSTQGTTVLPSSDVTAVWGQINDDDTSDEMSLRALNSPRRDQKRLGRSDDVEEVQGLMDDVDEVQGLMDDRHLPDDDHAEVDFPQSGSPCRERPSFDVSLDIPYQLEGYQLNESELIGPLITNGQGIEFEQMLRLTSINRDFLSGP